MNVESRQEPKFKVGDKITNGKGIFTIVTLSSDKYIVEDSFGRYGFLHFKNQDEWEIVEEKDLDLKFKAGDRVFNKVSRKWVNIIEFDIETGLYIVRYDDGIQGRSLESELRFMEEKSKSHNDMCKKLIEEMNPNVEVNVKTKPEPKSLPSHIKQIEEETKPKPSNTVSVDKAAEVFADMLIELCPELLGFGGAAKEWENEFRKRLEE